MGATVPEVIGTVPHQLDRLTDQLRDPGGLHGGIREEMAAEGSTPFDDVACHLLERQSDGRGDIGLSLHRRLETRPDLGTIRRTSAMAAPGSSALLLRKANWNRKSTVFVKAGAGGSGCSAARSSTHRLSSDSLSTVPGPQLISRASTAAMHWPEGRRAHRHPAGNGHDVGDTGHRLHRCRVGDGDDRAVHGRGTTHHRRQRVWHCQVERENLLAGHRGQCVDPALGAADHAEL